MQIRTLLFLGLLLPSLAPAAEPILSSYRLEHPGAEELFQASRLFEVVKLGERDYEILAPASQSSLLDLIAPRATLLEFDTSAALKRELAGYRGFTAASGGYHSWAEVQAWMQEVAKSHPEIAEVIEYGKTANGNPLLALRITRKNAEPKPAVLLTAATHGDELITTEVMLALVDRLVAGFGVDARLSGFVERLDIFFVPVVNPDGFTQVARYEGGRDPNRSYPYPEKPNQMPTPSIKALNEFFLGRDFVGTLDFHAFGELVMYPWAYTDHPVDLDSARRFHSLTGHMAEQNQYTFGPISEVIYIAPGSSADFYFWQRGSTSVAVEIGHSKIPRPEQFRAYVESQAESTWRFLEAF